MNRRDFLRTIAAAQVIPTAGQIEGVTAGIVALERRAARAVGAWFRRGWVVTGLGRGSLWILDNLGITITKADLERRLRIMRCDMAGDDDGD